VLRREGELTRIAFYPLTGRTHQLRVHAAHPRGLNAPNLGRSPLWSQRTGAASAPPRSKAAIYASL
jgi:23S rRNA-/tRNA-specific pseudouridylate synthase